MNVLSLFDGISCGQFALGACNIPVENYIASEINEHAIKCTRSNYPDTMFAGNVENLFYLNGVLYCTDWLGVVKVVFSGSIGLLIGGSPCQGFSYSGLKLNFNDPRSRLYFEYRRLLNEIKCCNPDVLFLLENVTMRQEWQDVISEHLNVDPVKINSGLVSAQSRKRLYWTNIGGGSLDQPQDRGVFLKHILLDNVAEKYYLTDKARAGFVKRLSNNKNRGAGFGHNLMTGEDKSKTILARYYKDGKECLIADGDRWRKLTPVEVERLQTLPDNYTASLSDTQRYIALGNGWNAETIKHIFSLIEI